MATMGQYTPEMLAVLTQIPDCIKSTVVSAIATNGCRGDIACLCKNDNFLTTLVKALLKSCVPSDQDTGLGLAQALCSKTVPSLNDSRQTEVIAIIVVMMFASTVAVILRLIARWISAARYGYDDLFIIIALVFTYGLNVNELIGVHFGYGKHQLMLSLQQTSKFLLNDWSSQLIFSCSITATRCSLLFFYHRVFPIRTFSIVVKITGCIVIGWFISFFVAIIFSCYPVHGFWDRAVEAKCFNENTFSYGITSTELATNIIMLILPIPWLWELHLPKEKKLALLGIFMLGSFVCIACVVRFPLLRQLIQTDASYTIVPTGMWVIVECNIGIASVCLPIMRPLFTRHVSHPVRSRFSAFSWTKASNRTSRRLSYAEAGVTYSSDPNLSGKTLVTNPLPPGAGKYNNLKPHGMTEPLKPEEMELDVISHASPVLSKPSPKLSSIGQLSPSIDSAKGKRRKEYWEMIEEREQEETMKGQHNERMNPSKWEHRKKEWERIERMNSKLGQDSDRRTGTSLARPLPPNDDSWYHGWGNRLGNGDGNQGWELELGPLAAGVEVPPSARLRSEPGPVEPGPVDFGQF